MTEWLTAIRAPKLGSTRLIRLIEYFGDIEEIFSANPATLAKLGVETQTTDYLNQPDERLLESDLDWLSKPNHHLITWGSDDYPDMLSGIPSPPAALFVAGDIETILQPQIAIIGSRNPTAGGLDNARDFAGEIARRGFAVTSGLASGIDSAAHDAAMDQGGRTIAVTGTGPDQVYPASSRNRAKRIFGQGALVTEFPPGTPARRQNFPTRNRIISGLTLGVLVVEAGLNSGTLITARMGSEQGREVFAIPGSIHNPMSKGCHRLIREGVRLVETVDEIIEGIKPMATEMAQKLNQRLNADSLENESGNPKMTGKPHGKDNLLKSTAQESDPDYQRLLENIGFDPKPVDRLIEQSGLTAREVSAMLLMLELRGTIEAHPGGAFSRKKAKGEPSTPFG